MSNPSNTRGFTLTEILVALAIFALGGTAIMALFITNARLSQQAMDQTRAAEITRNIRSLMTKSLGRPINQNNVNIYEFYYPGSSLTFVPDEYLDQYETGDGPTTEPTDAELGGGYADARIFFRLPDQPFNATGGGSQANNAMIQLPENALTPRGGQRSIGGSAPTVFRLLPDKLRRAGALDGLDPDDRMFYQFDMSIRRSVLRSSAEDPRNPGTTLSLEDLYVVHVRIYKGFDFDNEDAVKPYFEWDFYVSAAR